MAAFQGAIAEVACPKGWFGCAAAVPAGLKTAIQTGLRHPDLGGLNPAEALSSGGSPPAAQRVLQP